MSTIQDVSAEQLAKVFHHYWDALAHDGEANQAPAKQSSANHGSACCSWDRTPQSDRKLMVAAARLALLELSSTPVEAPRRKYYATPGEAEWGS
jgi:hypothetical protein